MTKKKKVIKVDTLELKWFTVDCVPLKETTKRFLPEDKAKADEFAKYRDSYVGEAIIHDKESDEMVFAGYYVPA